MACPLFPMFLSIERRSFGEPNDVAFFKCTENIIQGRVAEKKLSLLLWKPRFCELTVVFLLRPFISWEPLFCVLTVAFSFCSSISWKPRFCL